MSEIKEKTEEEEEYIEIFRIRFKQRVTKVINRHGL